MYFNLHGKSRYIIHNIVAFYFKFVKQEGKRNNIYNHYDRSKSI